MQGSWHDTVYRISDSAITISLRVERSHLHHPIVTPVLQEARFCSTAYSTERGLDAYGMLLLLMKRLT